MSAQLRAPFPWFGAKDRAAAAVWEALGDVTNYVEPFAGTLSVLLARPHAAHIETVNDLDGFVVNFWRAVAADPDGLTLTADWPVTELDLHARHAWLIERREGLTARLTADPDYFDAKVAGWWLWGICAWIGDGWCSEPSQKLPALGDIGRGINALWMREQVPAALRALRDRLRRTRVACGDWSRVLTPALTTACHGGSKRGTLTGVLLDPPYAEGNAAYSGPTAGVAAAVAQWARKHGDDPMMRVVLCGHEGEHEMPPTWRCVAWSAKRGYATDGGNRERERLWLSPHCLDATKQRSLFAEALR